MDIKWQVAMLTMRVNNFMKKTGRNLKFNGKETVRFDKIKVECFNFHRRGHFARECRAPRTQGYRNRDNANTQRNASANTSNSTALIVHQAYQAQTLSQLNANKLNNSQMSQLFENVSESDESQSDEDDNLVNNKYKIGKGYHAVPPPYTGNYLPLRPDLSFAGLDDSVFKFDVSEIKTGKTKVKSSESELNKEKLNSVVEPVVNKPKVVSGTPIIEEWDSDSDD
ncbi:ribonuclease H-like domain-containing protein [Tanacetum coccineum]